MNQRVLSNVRPQHSLNKKRLALAVMAALSTAPIVTSASPAGDEFLVNTYTTGSQTVPAIAMEADGDFVVAWSSFGQDGSSNGVYAQRYDVLGNPQGGEFRVNAYTTNNQGSPAVAMEADGDFVVTWSSFGQDGSSYGVYAQIYQADGSPLGPQFPINTYTTDNQRQPAIAVDADGDFVVTWRSDGQDGSSYGVYAQRFNALGNPQGSEIQVNTYTTDSQSQPAIAVDADGDFVVTWQSDGQDGSSYGVYAQRFDALGNPQGGEFQVNTYATGNQEDSTIAMDTDGDFVVTWNSPGQDGDSFGVYAQRFNAQGNPQGPELQVNTYTTSFQSVPAIAMDADGDFVVTWRSYGQDASSSGIYAQRFDALGNPQGGEFQVNSYTSDLQTSPAIAMDGDGDFVVTWESLIQDGSSSGVYMRKYSISPLADFNKDHYADIFWRQGITGQNTIWNMQGFDRLGVNNPPTVNTVWRVGGIGDINGDGYQDVVWRNTTTGANLGWLFQPDGSKVNASLPSLANTDWEMKGLGDIDGNGHKDIIWRNTNDGRNAAWRLDTIGGGLNVTSGNLNQVGDTNWEIEGIGDVDGDQKADLIWRNQSDGRNTVWLMNDLVSTSVALPKVSLLWTLGGVGDLNGDEKTDIVWRSDIFGWNAVWLMDTANVSKARSILTIPDTNWQVAQVTDHSGDGNADIMFRNNLSGQNLIFNMEGAEVSFPDLILPVGNTNFKAQPED